MKYAVVCASGLGDALISMVLSHNLKLSGHHVTTYSTLLSQLADWFPGHTILPFPEISAATFAPYDHIFCADHAPLNESHPINFTLFKEDAFDKTKTLVQNLADYCKNTLNLPHYSLHNGITPPPHLTHRKHKDRLLIHPMSTEERRTWPAAKFLKLSRRLRRYDTYFCTSPSERPQWEPLIDPDHLPLFPSLPDLAAYIYESGWLIGNNSGLGHLASCLHIPSLSLFARKSYSRLWRPGWGHNRVVTPYPLLPGGSLKQRHWKKLLTVGRASRHFHTFTKKRGERD